MQLIFLSQQTIEKKIKENEKRMFLSHVIYCSVTLISLIKYGLVQFSDHTWFGLISVIKYGLVQFSDPLSFGLTPVIIYNRKKRKFGDLSRG